MMKILKLTQQLGSHKNQTIQLYEGATQIGKTNVFWT